MGSESFNARARGSSPPGSLPLHTSFLAGVMTMTRGSADTLGLRFAIARGADGERQAEEPDEALGVRRVVAGHVEGSEARAIKRPGARARDGGGAAAEELHRHFAR